MKDSTALWMKYAKENLESSKILLESKLYNPCLQNVQQAVEKAMKALLFESSLKLKRTHSINELSSILEKAKIYVPLTEDECDLLDSIYLPSKYPLAGTLPDFDPDAKICRDLIVIAERIFGSVNSLLK